MHRGDKRIASGNRDVVVECSESIAEPAAEVWRALRAVVGIVVPAGRHGVQGGETPDRVAMEQRTVEIDDRLMMIQMEMTSGRNVPWSSCRSRLRVEPVDSVAAKVNLICLAVPTADPARVEGILRDLVLESLQTFKERLEGGESHQES